MKAPSTPGTVSHRRFARELASGILQQAAIADAGRVAAWLDDARIHGVPVPAWIAGLPIGSAQLSSWWTAHLADHAALDATFGHADTHVIIARSTTIGHGLIHRATVFAFTVLILFFLLRDRDAIVAQLRLAANHAFGASGERIGQQILTSVRGTIDGLVLVGLAEGVIVGVLYAATGVPHPVLLGLVSGIAAMIPFGLVLMLAIAVVLLLAKTAIVGAIIVGVVGFAVNFIADHYVRPTIISGATKLPFPLVLIGILGGVETAGLLGLFIGPAVMSTLALIWREWLALAAASEAPRSAAIEPKRELPGMLVKPASRLMKCAARHNSQ